MRLHRLSILIVLALVTSCSHAQAESWECGGARVHCGGSPQTCQRLKNACTEEVMASSDVDRELAQAVKDAKEGTSSRSDGEQMDLQSRSMQPMSCTEQQAQSGKCGMLHNSKALASYVVGSIKSAVHGLNQAASILGGK